MAKNKAKRALQVPQNDRNFKKTKVASITTPPPDGSSPPKTLNDLGLTQDDLEISVDTLNTLADNSGIIKLKDCKDLRTAVFNFRKACTTGLNATGGSCTLGIFIHQSILTNHLKLMPT